MELAPLPAEVFRVPPQGTVRPWGRRPKRMAAVSSHGKDLNREYRMTRWPRKMTVLFLAAVLAAGVSCTSDDSMGPSAPSNESSMGQMDGQQSELILGGLLDGLKNLHLLSCSPQPYASRTQVVGRNGGTIVVGTHRLDIPAGALTRDVTIRAEQVTHRVNSVRFSPEGLKFARPVKLTLSYANCSPLLLLKRVVYTDELLRILELIPSLDNLKNKTVTGEIRHFSRYAVAW